MLTFLQFPWIYEGTCQFLLSCVKKKKRENSVILLQIRQAFISRHFFLSEAIFTKFAMC